MSSGRISTAPPCRPRWPTTRGASGATARVLAESLSEFELSAPHPVTVIGQRFRDLRLRVASAAILAPVALWCVWEGGLAWACLVLAAAGLLGWEWARLRGPATARAALTPLAIVAVAALGLLGLPLFGLGIVAGSVALSLAGLPAIAAADAPRLRFGVPYVAIAALALIAVRADPVAGRGNMVFLMAVVWSCDIGAYAIGRLVGGPLLAPAISPGKTWAGAVGGLLAAMAAGVALAAALGPAELGWGEAARAAASAGCLAVASQLGDLFESLVKRRAGAKDSGRLIPGHGGLLDRLDGLVAAAPVAAALAMLLGPGVALWR